MRHLLHRSRAGRGAIAIVVIGLLLILAQLTAIQEHQPRWLGLHADRAGADTVLTWVQPGSWAWDSGARPGQLVLAVNGLSAADVPASQVSSADSVVVQDSAGQPLQVSLQDMTWAVASDKARLLHHAITAAFVIVSCIVFVLAADVLAAAVLLVLATSVGVMFQAVLAQPSGVAWSFYLVFGAVVTMGSSALLFFLLFPIDRRASAWGRVLIRACLIGYVVQLACLVWVVTLAPLAFEVFKPITFLMLIVQMAIAIGLVVFAVVRMSPERRQARRTLALVALGSTVALAPLCLLSLLPYVLFGFNIVPPSDTVLTIGLMPASLGVAILSRQFLGIQRLVRRGLVTLLVWIALLALYTQIWRLPILQAEGSGMNDVMTAVKLAIALATFPLLQRRVTSVLERVLFRDVYDPATTLRRIGNQIVHESGVETIADYTLSELGKTLDLTWAAIVLRGPEDRPLVFCWGSCPTTLDHERAEQAMQVSGTHTRVSDSEYLVPLVAEGTRVGVMLVGPKRHDLELLGDDESLLHSLAPVVATALDHALLVLRLEAQVAVLAQRERDLAGLNARLIRVQEEERRKLALDLHDDPLQRAAMLHRRLGALERVHAEVPDLEVCRESAELIEVGLRAICVGLRPRMLDDLGLEAAAQWLVRDVRARSDLEIELDVSTWDGSPFGRLDPDLEIGLYRVAQEGLNNAVKHAHARHVAVVLSRDDDAVRLRVIDDGQGLGDGSTATSLGLLGMQERLAAWSASVRVDNGPYGGVEVAADVPLAPRASIDAAA